MMAVAVVTAALLLALQSLQVVAAPAKVCAAAGTCGGDDAAGLLQTRHKRAHGNTLVSLTQGVCQVNEHVACPDSGVMCHGEQCCPGQNGSLSYVCPSAPPGFGPGACQMPHKRQDCLAPALGTTEPPVDAAACPYGEVTTPCSIGADGNITQDCLLGSAGESTVVAVDHLTVFRGVRLVIARGSSVDVKLAASGITLHGELWAGCEGGASDAFMGRLLLEFVGDGSTLSRSLVRLNMHEANVDTLTVKGMAVTGTGRLELHGAPKEPWQYLAANAEAGATELTLDAPVDWQPWDEVVVGSTSVNREESEVAVVAGVSGCIVKLQKALVFAHAGNFTGQGARLNAPVGLRTHNVKLRGRMADGSDENEAAAWQECFEVHTACQAEGMCQNAATVKAKCFGGHTLFLQHSMVHIEHAEFTNMGENMVMARYPVHWHMAGNASGQYVRRSSMHNNFQRCTTVHGTADVLVAENVCHETFGHAFYLEDGIETGNTFQRNLVVNANPGASVCSDFQGGGFLQLGTSGFWITNPDNSFLDNHVIGVGTGYWFTFPVSSTPPRHEGDRPGQCELAPDSVNSCSDSRYGAGGVFGPSRDYFDDSRSGYGPESWWTNQEQARTPVRLFKGNVASTSLRAMWVDSRVYDSEDKASLYFSGGDIPCFGIQCPTCVTDAEQSFIWAPMTFDKFAAITDRRYQPAVNVFEDFYAAHIKADSFNDRGRSIWAAGGSILFKGAVFYNVARGIAGIPDPTGACYKVTPASPGAYPLVFQDSLFISGPVTSEFFTVYDSGIHAVNSRWVVPRDTNRDFYIAKPKEAFGGNGNPVYLEKTGPLGKFPGDADNDNFKWAMPLAPSPPDGTITNLADFTEVVQSNSPYLTRSFVYSADGFGLADALPTIVAADATSNATDWGVFAKYVSGAASAQSYIQDNPPQFTCGSGYGKWCGYGIELSACPAYGEFYMQLAPWATAVA